MENPIELNDAETAAVAGGLFNNITLVYAHDNTNSLNTTTNSNNTSGAGALNVGSNVGHFWRSFNSFSI